MDSQPLFTMDELDPINASLGVFHPKARVAQHYGHRREGLKVLFVDVFQVVRVGGLLTKPDAECVKHAIVLGVGSINLWKLPVFNELIIHD
jgi:hypothetical protein